MNVLITGTNGFLGGSLSTSDILQNHTVFKIESSKSSSTDPNTLRIDLTSPHAATTSIAWLSDKKIDLCFHFAAVTPFHGKAVDFSQDLEMAKTIQEICEKMHIPKLIYSSGWVVYTNPINEYGQSKLQVENYFKNSLKKTTFINLRLASVYGPGQKSKGLIPNLIRSAIDSEKMTIRSLKTKGDYVYIDDFLSLCLDIMEYKGKGINLDVGSGESYSVEEVAKSIQDIFQEVYGLSVPIKVEEPITESDPLDNRLDNSEVEKVFKFQPTTSLRKGLLCYIQWMKKNQ